MTLRDYWDIVRGSWLLILGVTVAGALAALGLSMLQTPIYQAQAQLFVSVQGATRSEALSGGSYIQERMRSYVEVVDTPNVLDPVVERLGLDKVPDVTAESPSGTVLLSVTATSPDPVVAAKVTNAAAKALAGEIVRLETTATGSKPVQAELIRPADVPTTPVSPRTQVNIVLGALLGLMLGAGIAILRTTLDTSVKSVEELQDATQSTLLGHISFDSGAAKSPLVTLEGSPRAEAYRSLRTNLQYVDVDSPPRCVVITSSLPLEGKSTTAANLAIAMAQGGAKVLLVEADLRRPRVAEYLGVEGSIGLTDVLIGQARLDDALIPWQRGLLHFLPSGAIPPNPSELLGSQQLADVLAELRTRYSLIILDAPPLLPVTDAAILATAADGAILVARFGETRREQVEQSAEALRQVNARLLGTVLNFVPERRRARGYEYGYGYGYEQPTKGGSHGADSGRRVLSPAEVPSPAPRV